MPKQNPTMAICLTQECDWDRLVETEELSGVLELLHLCVRHPETARRRKREDGTTFDPEAFLRQNKDVVDHYRRAI